MKVMEAFFSCTMSFKATAAVCRLAVPAAHCPAGQAGLAQSDRSLRSAGCQFCWAGGAQSVGQDGWVSQLAGRPGLDRQSQPGLPGQPSGRPGQPRYKA